MTSISSAIVVLAGIHGMLGSKAIAGLQNSSTTFITFVVSLIVLVLGLVGWWTSLKHER